MNIKSDSVLKAVLFLFLSVTALWILLLFANNTNCGHSGFGIHIGSAQLDSNWYYPATWHLNFFLLSLFRISCFLFIIGLVVWLSVVIRDHLIDHRTNGKMNTTSIPASEIPTAYNQTVCIKCGKSIENDWKVCAFCGEELKSSS